jgi:ribosomal 50S subunit-recycling heat shock protein
VFYSNLIKIINLSINLINVCYYIFLEIIKRGPTYQKEEKEYRMFLGESKTMRIDKFLKVSRLIKRRELAKEMLDREMITLNGKVAKPSSEVKEEDQIVITSPSGKTIKAVIKKISEYSTIESAQDMYEIKEG